jgi:erythronate-4-phosphate dehydrogenase
MKIIADENIPHAREAFAQFGDVHLHPGRSITSLTIRDCDALIIRSVTRVDEALLGESSVRFVGTATIGTDHLDLNALARRSITVADAAGCNSTAVAEYVVAALLELRSREIITVENNTLGIVGVGRIGSIVDRYARALRMRTVLYDPPRAEREDFASATLDELGECDAITLHVPLTNVGPHATMHLVDETFLERTSDVVLINASRGAVVDSNALISALTRGSVRSAVLDVWEGEPNVPIDLINRAEIATPHVAGYSFDGKIRGTTMMADALARFAGTARSWEGESLLAERAGEVEIDSHVRGLDALNEFARLTVGITIDDSSLRSLLILDDEARRSEFDRLRKGYRKRREWGAYDMGKVPDVAYFLQETRVSAPE